MTLFDRTELVGGDAGPDGDAPLAERMRPKNLEEVVGQTNLTDPASFLAAALRDDRVPSLIFWGPPGTGKTTLARIVARETQRRFVPFSAVTSGIKEIKQVMAEASRLPGSLILFVDEIHRFNRAQQDAFLPYVERGEVILIGATTENPSFELNGALLSRARVIVLEPLGVEELTAVLERAVCDSERGLDLPRESIESDAAERIAVLADGDARRALNLLEAVVADAQARTGSEDALQVGVADVERVSQRKTLYYDKAGEEHYNLISALHKSLRESDADASVYWLARMLEAGEDPLYVARRLVRFASEDIGLADPAAVGRTLDAWDAYARLGSPEGDIMLYQATIYLALVPKSTAVYEASKQAKKAALERPADPVPHAIRNAPTRLMKNLGYGKGYRYAPSESTDVTGIDCLPEALEGTRFYRPTSRGFERRLGDEQERLDALRQDLRGQGAAPDSD